MSTTLARKIRRIGMMRTTYKTVVVGEKLVKDENGNPSIVPETRTHREFHFDEDVLRSKKEIAEAITDEWRQARKARNGKAQLTSR